MNHEQNQEVATSVSVNSAGEIISQGGVVQQIQTPYATAVSVQETCPVYRALGGKAILQ